MNDWLTTLNAGADLWLAGMLRAAWQGGLALGAVWLVGRRWAISPRWMVWGWRLACLKLFFAAVWLEPVELPVLPAAGPLPQRAPLPAVAALPITGTVEPGSPVRRQMHPEVSAAGARVLPSAAALLLGAWFLGVVWQAGRTARQWRALRQVLRQSRLAESPRLAALLGEAVGALGLDGRAARVRLLVSSSEPAALLVGVWRPAIVLPEQAEHRFDAEELRLMLAHELGHLARRDLAWNWLPTLATWCFYFHPLIWLARREWLAAQEAACDELLIERRAAQPWPYARLLVKLGRLGSNQPAVSLLGVGVTGSFVSLERRIVAMARVSRSSRRRRWLARTTLALTAVVGLVPWTLVARAQRATEPEPPARPATGPVPANAGAELPGRIYAYLVAELIDGQEYRGVASIDPNTGEWTRLGSLGQSLRVSPDGRHLAYQDLRPGDPRVDASFDLYVADVERPEPVLVAENAMLPCWSADGKRILFSRGTMPEDLGWRGKAFVYDLESKQVQELSLPETDEVDDWASDGDWLVTVSDRHPPHGSGYQLYVMHADGSGERRLTEGAGLNCYPRFSPDGRHLAYHHQRKGVDSLYVLDLSGGKPRLLMQSHDDGSRACHGACWSPDGAWLAVNVKDWTVRILPSGKREFHNSFGDGNERIEILSLQGESRGVINLKDVKKVNWLGRADWN